MLSKGHSSDNNPDSVLQADISSGLTPNMVSRDVDVDDTVDSSVNNQRMCCSIKGARILHEE